MHKPEEIAQTPEDRVVETLEEGESTNPIDERDALIQSLTDERDQFRDQLLRTVAELQTFRRRAAADKEEIRKYGIQDFAEELLPLLTNFERTIRALEASGDPSAIMQGVGMIERQLRSVLEANNVRRIVAVGEVFDPMFHEALGMVETEEFEPNVIVEELEPGYQLFDRVLRPARVRVAVRPSN